jgi:predicted metal-dependent hydrolase
MSDKEPASRREPRHLERRNVDFPFDAASVPRTWLRDDLWQSLFMDALSLVFPDGERFFVDSVKRFASKIDDPGLRADALAFAAQEGMHGREHGAFNEILAEQLDRAAVAKSEAEVRAILKLVRRVLPPHAQLAATCALEHFTALLAEQLLTHEETHGDMHDSVRGLWLWHALEESEHKAVAFDVYQAAGGTYPVRAGIMFLTTVVFFAEIANIHVRLLRKEGILFDGRAWVRGLNFMWGKPGFFRALIPRYFDYYRRDFHPDDCDASALHARWREKLLGEGGALRAFLKGSQAKAA